MNVNLGDHFQELVRILVASGRYGNVSEAVREGLRLLEDKEAERKLRLEALRQAIQEGRDSGAPIPASDVFDELEDRYRARAAESPHA